jgi:hypothetical protein
MFRTVPLSAGGFALESGSVDTELTFILQRVAPFFIRDKDGCALSPSAFAARTPHFCNLNGDFCQTGSGERIVWDACACSKGQHPG